MGTIQPSRFLSHTGKILPGVRRVIPIPNPGNGNNIVITVPAGVQWWVTAGIFSFATDAVVANRNVILNTFVDGLQVLSSYGNETQVASQVNTFSFQSTNGYIGTTTAVTRPILAVPGGYLPEGATIQTQVVGFDPGDFFESIAIWVEEVYVTDPQLSEIARTRAELDREIAAYEFQQAEQAQTGA